VIVISNIKQSMPKLKKKIGKVFITIITKSSQDFNVKIKINLYKFKPITSKCWAGFVYMSQPHFEASVRMRLALPKVGTWSPPGFSKFQSS
jgi:hypothetical protein